VKPRIAHYNSHCLLDLNYPTWITVVSGWEPEKRLPHPRKAAGAQITQSQNEEVGKENNETVLYEARYRNEYNSNPLMRIYERASLVPAAAVIPALSRSVYHCCCG